MDDVTWRLPDRAPSLSWWGWRGSSRCRRQCCAPVSTDTPLLYYVIDNWGNGKKLNPYPYIWELIRISVLYTINLFFLGKVKRTLTLKKSQQEPNVNFTTKASKLCINFEIIWTNSTMFVYDANSSLQKEKFSRLLPGCCPRRRWLWIRQSLERWWWLWRCWRWCSRAWSNRCRRCGRGPGT